jgi:ribosomal protein L25 (general stress protein Ctc)
MFNYDLGGNSVNPDVSEAMAEIAFNKTLFVQKLTADDPIRPEVVNLQTVDEVFNHYKPNVDVEFTKEDGSTVTENLKFNNVGSFNAKNIVNDSKYLKNVNLEHDAYLKIMKQLKTNKALKLVVENPETKEAFVNALRALASELDESE